MSNGLGILQSNLVFDSLAGGRDELGLDTNSVRLREWGWPIPEELVVFGGNGSDELFGVWLPRESKGHSGIPAVEVGSIFERKSFAIVGTDFPRFLAAWTAFYTIFYVRDGKVGPEALDALRLPEKIRTVRNEDDLLSEIFLWADPDLEDYNPNPYKRGIDADQIRARFGGN